MVVIQSNCDELSGPIKAFFVPIHTLVAGLKLVASCIILCIVGCPLSIFGMICQILADFKQIMGNMCGSCKETWSYLLKPWKIAIVICVAVWNLFSISFTHSWLEEDLLKKISSRLFPIYIHLFNILLIAVVLSFHSILVFKKKDFRHCAFTFTFCVYITAELIIMANALTMEISSRFKYYVESVFLFALLFLYTNIVSWEYQNHIETLRLLHEQAIERRISTAFKGVRGGGCVRIPLKDSSSAGGSSTPSSSKTN